MRDYIEQKGLFKALHVDKAGIFGGPKHCNFSQMQRTCEELGIEILFAHSPQGKGRIERSFDTFQDCNGQVKQDTFLSSLLIEFPLKFQWGLVA